MSLERLICKIFTETYRLPLGVEAGWYTRTFTYTADGHVACVILGVEDQRHFLIVCPIFKESRLQLFNYCYSLSQISFELTVTSKTHSI